MSRTPVALLSHLRTPAAPADAQLLERFVAAGEEAAFAQLVHRHGAMVLGVCRRLLRGEQDVEDAFQATFLVLARRAAAVRKAGSLGSWLHGVARRVALRARADAARRGARERGRPAAAPAAHSADEVTWRDVRAALDEELARLPERYRAPLVQCYLEGQTQDEAARRLGWSPRTLRRRLGRGRDLLRARLEGRGLALSAGLLGVALAERVGVGEALAVAAVGAGRPAGGVVGAGAARLADGVLRATLLTRLASLGALLALALALTGGALLAWGQPAAQPPAAGAEPPQPAEGKAQRRLDAQGDSLPAGALARLGTVRFRQGGPIEALSLSADGKRLASGGDDGVVRLWEVATGKSLRQIDATGAVIRGFAVALSPDGKTLATPSRPEGAAGPEQISLWDAATGKELRRMDGPPLPACSRLAFSPDGKVLVGGEWDGGKVHVWDAGTGKAIQTWQGHTGTVTAVGFSADGKRFVTGGADKVFRLWNAATGAEVRTFAGPTGRALCAALSPDGTLLAGGADDATARLWDAATGKELHVLKGHKYAVGAVAFSPDGRALLTGGHDGKILLWEAATGKQLKELPGRQGGLTGLFFTPDGKRVVCGGYDNTIRVRDLATGKEAHAFAGHQGRVAGVAYSPDGLLATASADGTVRLWSGAKEVRPLTVWGTGGASAVAFAPDGKALAAAAQGRIQLWDVANGKELRTWVGHTGWVCALAFSGDGKALASAGGDIRVWDPATGNEVRRIGALADQVSTLAFSPDGKVLAGGGAFPVPSPLRLWDAASGKALEAPPQSGACYGVAFSPDGALLAGACDKDTIRLWDVAKRSVVRSWKAGGEFVGAAPLAFSRDGRLLVAGVWTRLSDTSWEVAQTVRVWDVATGKERCSFRGHEGPILAVAVSPDGKVIASGSEDTTVLLWDLAGRSRAGR